MAQPSVAQYFNTRKRSAIDHKINKARKVLILDEESYLKSTKLKKTDLETDGDLQVNVPKISHHKSTDVKITSSSSRQKPKIIQGSKTENVKERQCIQTFLDNMRVAERCVTPPNPIERDTDNNTNIQGRKQNYVEKDNEDLSKIKKKILQSSRLKEIKASINKFKDSAEQLKAIEKKTNEILVSPKLKTFKSIEFEVTVSPQKTQSPEKPYLSPKKEVSVRKNLMTILSPTKRSSTLFESTKEVTDISLKQGLQLPFKYRTLAEVFRAVDTISQMLYNRKEIITLQKVKAAVEEMLKKTFNEKHLAQIKYIYPDAYNYRQEKIKQFGSRQEEWNLVIDPNINNVETMTPEIVLERRRKFHQILIDLVKKYHNEFLLSLTPPMIISKDKIMRWHPEFDLEKVPDVDLTEIPKVPVEEKFTSGKEVLEKARQMFNCNTRMEQALAKLAANKNECALTEGKPIQSTSLLKGIPKALLEKVRQKQAAKVLISMTRSIDKDKEVQMYSRLPEIARLVRNLFVSEKKSVLPLDVVTEKLGNSYRSFLNRTVIEEYLKAIATAVPDWLVFHKLRNSIYLKLAKSADLNKVLNKLEKLAKEKNEV